MLDDGKETILKYLELLGIKGYEGKAYLTLLRMGEATAPRIATKSGIPLPRIYDVLENLCRKGLVEVKAGRPRKYQALPPSVALTRYVKTYIEHVMKLNNKVVEELEKLYRTKESHEPYIWISHSIEASIERTLDWIKETMIDGYASLSKELFMKLINTLKKKLESNKNILFSVTLFKYPDKRIIRKIEDIPNIRLLYQPTGFIKALEHDFKRAIIFGKNYTLFTTEPELMILLNDTYYFGYWRNAEVIKDFSVKRGEKYTTKHQWLSMPIIDQALKNNYNVRLYVVGKLVKTGKPVELEAYAKEVFRSPDDRTRTIICENMNGEKITIGGHGASVEDVEAYYIELVIE